MPPLAIKHPGGDWKKQRGMFDVDWRLEKKDGNGDPLLKLNEIIDWELFRPELERLRLKERKSNAGRKPYDAVLMLKVLILQSLLQPCR